MPVGHAGIVNPPFTPLRLEPVLWLDASDSSTITSSSGKVSQWNDKSSGARHVAQATSANQPATGTTTQNGLNGITFTYANATYLKATGLSAISGTKMTFFFVVKATNTTSLNGRLLSLSVSGGYDYNSNGLIPGLHMTNTDPADFGMYYNLNNRAKKTIANNTPAILMTQRDGDSSSAWTNNNSVNTVSGLGTTSLSITQIYVGGSNFLGPGDYLNATLFEVLWFNRALATTEREAIRDYLNAKWAIY